MHQYYESGSEEEGQHRQSAEEYQSSHRDRRHHKTQQQAPQRRKDAESLEEGEAEGDTGDSLDIKPPQAMRTDRKRKKSDRHHQREERHRSNNRGHGREDRSASRNKEERHYQQQQHYQGHQRHEKGSGGGVGRYEEEIRRVSYENNRDSHYGRSSKANREHSKKPSPHDSAKPQPRDAADQGDRMLEDLRSRLLSKRSQMETTTSERKPRREESADHYSKEQQQRVASNKSQYERRDDRESSRHGGKRDHKQQQIVEMIDSPEAHYYSEERDYRENKSRREQPQPPPSAKPIEAMEEKELLARRAKLLEAEREMSQRKELARLELEKRREKRRGRDEGNDRLRERSESPDVERKRSRKMDKKEAKKQVVEEEVVSLSDRTSSEEEEDDDDEEDGDNGKGPSRRESDDESASGSASNSDDNDEEDEEEENSKSESDSSDSDGHSKSDIDLPCSPLSIGDLAKSDHSRRTRSESRSSKSTSRSHSRSRSKSPRGKYSDDDDDDRTDDEDDHDRRRTNRHTDDEEAVEKEDVVMVEPVDEEEVKRKKAEEEKKAFEASLPNYYPALQGCRSVEEFLCLNRIEEGTYGVVYRAKDKRTDEVVALKRLKMEKEKEGFPITSLREINTLLKGQHPNIVTVREIVVGSNMDKIYLVMDYVEHDLKSLMETMRHKKQTFLPAEVKCLLQQLLRAVAHLHDNWILHRDLKTSNLLLSHKGILKVGDFGLAREYGSPLKPYTSVVVTLWYRAPELLLCCKEYSTPIDVWSVGCIFAEFMTMQALFPGKSELDQLNRIFKDLGTPNEKIWEGYNELPAVQNGSFTEYPVSRLRQKFATVTSEFGLGLLQGLLTYDPKKRLTADLALKSNYFKELPLPIDPAMFPSWPAKSELGARKALASSPKPPSGGSQFKQLGGDDQMGFHLGPGGMMDVQSRAVAMGPGFSLKF